MATHQNFVSWNAALSIWFGQAWRIFLVNLALAAAILSAGKMIPVIHHVVSGLNFSYSGSFGLAETVLEIYISLWGMRQSLMDRYGTFTLKAENKETARTMYGFDKRLGWNLLIPVWWAQAWRTAILSIAIVVGIIAASLFKHQDPAAYLYLARNQELLSINFIASLAISLWATKESLADRYRRFRFIAVPTGVYDT